MFSLDALEQWLHKRNRMGSRSRIGFGRNWRRLHVEPLENRVMLNADPMGGEVLVPAALHTALAAEVADVSNQGEASEQDSTLLARFSSREQLEQHLIEDALERWSGWFGSHATYWGYWPDRWRWTGLFVDAPMIWAATGSVVTLEANSSHSETNTQVAGVDEGDLVETDGEYLYVLSGEELVIVDTALGDMRVASRVQVDGQPFEQYLSGDRLTILSRSLWSTPPAVRVTVLDVSDREAPKLVQETHLDGAFVDSRAIGDYVYVVLRDGFELPPPQRNEGSGVYETREEYLEQIQGQVLHLALPRFSSYGPEGSGVYETKEEYLERIQGQVLDLALPRFSSYGPDGELVESGLLSEATDIYQPQAPDDTSLISVVVFDVTSDVPGPISSTSIPANDATEVYVSTESIYVLKSEGADSGEETSILKCDFHKKGARVKLSAIGSVPGHVLNQFSVDEYNGYLRIATTQGRAGRWEGKGNSQNNLYVLEQHGQELEIVGRLENLAPGEKIYSARFMEESAFVVTYRKVDPLFAIDLSNPTEPQVAGELKIPGFSNYLHAVEDEYLIGIGRNADEHTGLFQDPQVSLFHVEDLSHPELLDRFTIDTGRAGGQGIFEDHHVIAYYPEYEVLTVSVPDGGDWRGGSNDLWVFKIDVRTDPDSDLGDGNLQFLGRIEHDSSISRSVRIDDLLYAISTDTVTVHEILSPDTQLEKLSFGTDQSDPVSTFRLPGVINADIQMIEPYCPVTQTNDGNLPGPLLWQQYFAAWQPPERAPLEVVAAPTVPETLVYQDGDSLSDRSVRSPSPSVAFVNGTSSDDALPDPVPDRSLRFDSVLGTLKSEPIRLWDFELEPSIPDVADLTGSVRLNIRTV